MNPKPIASFLQSIAWHIFKPSESALMSGIYWNHARSTQHSPPKSFSEVESMIIYQDLVRKRDILEAKMWQMSSERNYSMAKIYASHFASLTRKINNLLIEEAGKPVALHSRNWI